MKAILKRSHYQQHPADGPRGKRATAHREYIAAHIEHTRKYNLTLDDMKVKQSSISKCFGPGYVCCPICAGDGRQLQLPDKKVVGTCQACGGTIKVKIKDVKKLIVKHGLENCFKENGYLSRGWD